MASEYVWTLRTNRISRQTAGGTFMKVTRDEISEKKYVGATVNAGEPDLKQNLVNYKHLFNSYRMNLIKQNFACIQGPKLITGLRLVVIEVLDGGSLLRPTLIRLALNFRQVSYLRYSAVRWSMFVRFLSIFILIRKALVFPRFRIYA